MSTTHAVAVVLVAAATTWALRAVPFALLRPLRDSELLTYLGERMPVGVMLVLTVYTLRDTTLAVTSAGPTAIALAVTAVLHLWRRNAILSIVCGTAVYAVLASLIAAA